MIGAVDIGGTKIAAGLVSDGRLVERTEIPTSQARMYSPGIEHIARMLAALTNAGEIQLEGIGIGLTGRLDPASGRIGRNGFLPDWEGQDLAGDLEKLFQVQVGIENDADAAALAEAAWGAGRGKSRFIYITVGTGIGGGVVLDGRLYRGISGAHPELGHHTLDPNGPACYCGARGCWERFASGSAMLQRTLDQVETGLLPAGLDARQICELAASGVGWAKQAVQEESTYLGLGLANLVTLFAPDCIALGGGVMRHWPLFAPAALSLVQQNCKLVPAGQVLITQASLGEEAPLLGAAQAWLQLDRR